MERRARRNDANYEGNDSTIGENMRSKRGPYSVGRNIDMTIVIKMKMKGNDFNKQIDDERLAALISASYQMSTILKCIHGKDVYRKDVYKTSSAL